MSPATLVLITGYARSGKDTLAEGIMAGIAAPTRWAQKRSFADTLKEGANEYLKFLQLESDAIDFYNEEFKVRHRDYLVAAGRLARSVNVDVFAAAFTRKCLEYCTTHGPGVVVCPDWRYLNEYRFVKLWLGDCYGWRIVTVNIDTAGLAPANEEEGVSIGAITREMAFDISLKFQPDRSQLIKAEGKNIARQIGL